MKTCKCRKSLRQELLIINLKQFTHFRRQRKNRTPINNPILISTGLLNKPVLYISDFFERNRISYYDSLSMVKQSDNMTQWLKFFLNGIIETSKNSIKTFDEIIKLKKEVDNKLATIGKKLLTVGS